MLYSIGPINVCTDFEINRYKFDEVRKYAKIVFYLTSRDAKTLRHASWGLRHLLLFWQGTFWNQPEVSTTSVSKVTPQIVVFVFSVTLTVDLCSIVCHTHCAWCTGISMQSFIRIRPVILGDMPRTDTQTHRCTPKIILIVFASARLIMLWFNCTITSYHGLFVIVSWETGIESWAGQ